MVIKIACDGMAPESLRAELGAALAPVLRAVQFSRGQVVVDLDEAASPADVRLARAIVGDHTPPLLTRGQQTALARRADHNPAHRPRKPSVQSAAIEER